MKDALGKEADVFLDSDDLTVRRSIQLSRYNRFHKPCASKINFMRFPPRKMPVSKRSYIHSNLRTNETGPSITSGTRQGYGSIVGSSNFCSKPGSLFRFRKQFAPRSHDLSDFVMCFTESCCSQTRSWRAHGYSWKHTRLFKMRCPSSPSTSRGADMVSILARAFGFELDWSAGKRLECGGIILFRKKKQFKLWTHHHKNPCMTGHKTNYFS